MSGTRQWLRQCSLIVAPASGKDGLELSDLRVQFTATSRTTITEPDTLEARIYNLAPATTQALLAMPIVPPGQVITAGAPQSTSVLASAATGRGRFPNPPTGGPPAQVLLRAGYQGNFGTIFQGQLVQVRLGRESPMDDFVDLYAADGDPAHKWGIMNTTLAAGWKAEDVVKAAVQSCEKYGLGGEEFPRDTDPPQRPAPRGKVCFGMMREVLADVATTHRCDYWISRNNLEFVPMSSYKPGEAVVINSKTGMIGRPRQTNFGVSVQCLLNPAIARAARIVIDNASVQRAQFSASLGSGGINNILASNLDADGIYKVLMVNHVGDTRGNDWYTIAECISIDRTNPGGQVVPEKMLLGGL